MRGVSMGLALVGIIAAAFPAMASDGDHVVIAEIQVGGASAKDEFIELYNPTATPAHLEGWRLSKRTGSGAREENLVTTFPALDIAAHASVLVAHPDGAFVASADQKYTTQSSLANDNTVVLYGPAASDGQRSVVDLVGYGTVASKEGAAAPNPTSGQSLERKPGGAGGNGQDTNDNAADFAIAAAPTPQGASAAARPTITPTETPPVVPTPTDSESGIVGSPSTGSGTTDGTSTATAPTTEQPTTTTTTTTAETATTSATTDTNALVEPSRPTSPFPAPTHLRINEFVADPAAGDEWIELVNIGPQSVNLADWTIEDGSEARTALSGAIGIGEQRFVVIAKPKGQLNNSGDRIVLKNPSGNIVDAVTYGDWNDGKASDNAPTAADPASVARVVDGADTDDDRLDFVRTESPTRGQPNIVGAVPPPEGDAAPRATNAAPQTLVVLNELYPNPPGDDRADEYVELANIGQQPVDVRGWRIRDELGAEHVIGATDGTTGIAAGGFLILPRSTTGIALNDTGGETIRLYKPGSERAASVAEYSGAAADGAAWARASDGRWQWTTERTPNAANAIAAPNRSPDAVFAAPSEISAGAVVSFDGSDSVDPDREAIAYFWNFGDDRTEADVATDAIGRYVYEGAGTYTVALTVTDARGAAAIAKRKIVVRASPAALTESGDDALPNAATAAARRSAAPTSVSAVRSSKPSRRRTAAPAVAFALGDLRDAEVGSDVIVRGTVTAPPGSVGQQTFHIADDGGGVEVYVGKRAIPALAIGDRVEVRGELREVTGGLRVGIAAATDVRVIGTGATIIPEPLQARDVNAERLGALVAVEGEVVEVRGRVVAIDDGTDELRITLPANAAPTAAIARGDAVQATGILHRTSAGYRVLARGTADVLVAAKVEKRDPAAAAPPPTPLRNDLEYALLSGGSGALLASSLWRRRRIVALAAMGVQRLIAFGRRA